MVLWARNCLICAELLKVKRAIAVCSPAAPGAGALSARGPLPVVVRSSELRAAGVAAGPVESRREGGGFLPCGGPVEARGPSSARAERRGLEVEGGVAPNKAGGGAAELDGGGGTSGGGASAKRSELAGVATSESKARRLAPSSVVA